jgi:hypothetical protein
MERVYNFSTNGIASIAQVGSKNQAQPTRPIACICDLTSFDRPQPTPKMPQTPNKISPPKWDNEPRSRPQHGACTVFGLSQFFVLAVAKKVFF